MKKRHMPRNAFEKAEVDYLHKLSEAEREWLLKFNHDYHAGGVYFDSKVIHNNKIIEDCVILEDGTITKDGKILTNAYVYNTILTSDNMKKEARKNHNALARDAMDVAITRGALADIDDEAKAFMEEACDAWEYEREYKENGYKAGIMLIYDHAIRDINNKLVDVKITLTRFYEKMNRLRRIYRNDRARKNR